MKKLFITLIALLVYVNANAITVTITTDEGFNNPALIEKMQNNLSAVLTEINNAYESNSILNTAGLKMDEHAKTMLVTLWDVMHFYCDDEEVVDRCWQLKSSYLLRKIPLIIDPQDEAFTKGNYQEAVVEFDKNGTIIDFRFALEAQLSESMERCGSVVEVERRMIILDYVEQFRTAYCRKDMNFLEKIFSDDAVIITGKVITTRKSDFNTANAKIVYNKQTKQEYLRNLRRAFLRNKYIDVKFSDIGDDDSANGGCPGISRSQNNPNFYGVRLKQEWKSSTYSDEGYVFLLWNFTNENEPIIEVRTWQPTYVGTGSNGEKKKLAEEDIFNISSVEDMIK
ncbi:MAG: nuclear transport factor 2 family protein [Prevotellaceae bacterium]|nr:nuclear transport factor 2 family protein [Prevotellaceae bacterium]